jgi:hypothetical protein
MLSPQPEFSPQIPSTEDRRRHARYSVQVQIEIRQDGIDVPFRLQTTDLSRGGCYVELMMPLPIGTSLRATLWLDGSPLRVHGIVATRHPQFGNGIRFLDFEGNGEQLLTQYLDGVIEQE